MLSFVRHHSQVKTVDTVSFSRIFINYAWMEKHVTVKVLSASDVHTVYNEYDF
jgi:hypothetical protein